MPTYPILSLKPKEERRILGGHLWVFSNELTQVPRDILAGSLVTVERHSGEPLGVGFYNPQSLIAVRLLTRNGSELDEEAFFHSRFSAAFARRAHLLTRRSAARMIHGESDFLPGLIVDKFNDLVSFQITSQGFEVRKDLVIRLLRELLTPESIVERNSTHLRKLEGLPLRDGIVFGDRTAAEIIDARGTRFNVDTLLGQKTGFYLDQMENRTLAWDFDTSGEALDLFSNEGGFALNLARAGSRRVVAVDQSASALSKVVQNAQLNGISSVVETVEADCFEYLKSNRQQYSFVVLDPPALLKSKRDLPVARKAYLNLNMGAIRATMPDGILLSASCSHHLTREMLLEVVYEASRKTQRQISILAEYGAGIDHPVLLSMPETKYLKLFVMRIH